jgi:hypothetical protein
MFQIHRQSCCAILCSFMLSLAAAQDCPLIRPPGLSVDQVNSVVTNIFAQALRRPPQSLDPTNTIKTLDGTENASLAYLFASTSVGESLGFDALAEFREATKAKGGRNPIETLTLTELQALARAAYQRGTDSPPPEAQENLSYRVHTLSVSTPSPAQGWRLLQCGRERVTFQRRTETSQSTASVRFASLPRFESDAALVALASKLIPSVLPPALQAQPWQPQRARTDAPCADATITGQIPSGSVFLRAWICYEDTTASFGYATLFLHLAEASAQSPSAQAEEFVAGNSRR